MHDCEGRRFEFGAYTLNPSPELVFCSPPKDIDIEARVSNVAVVHNMHNQQYLRLMIIRTRDYEGDHFTLCSSTRVTIWLNGLCTEGSMMSPCFNRQGQEIKQTLNPKP